MKATKMLRQMVAQITGDDPKKIYLSGAIEPDATFCDFSHVGSLGGTTRTFRVWGFDPKKGVILLPIVGEETKSNYAYEGGSYSEPTPLWQCEAAKECVMFITQEYYYRGWEGSDTEEYTKTTVYSSPAKSLAAFAAEVEAADIQRWENWFSLPQTSNPIEI